jgi:hypothetical protein
MNRRTFAKTGTGFSLLLLSSGASFLIYGCNVYDDLYNWIGVGIASLNSMVTILKANGIIPAAGIVNAILGALSAVRAAIDEYKSTTPAPFGALAKIETALNDAVSQFGTFLRSLSILGFGLFSMIAALVDVILSTIAGFKNRLPPVAQKLNVTMQIAQLTGKAVIPKHRTIRVFKKDWNAVLDTGVSLDVTVPPSAYHSISFWEHL